MTQEDKDLLIKDLCARLPYEVKVQYEGHIFTIDYISATYEEVKLDTPDTYTIDVSEVKPYLFPLSSMTKEQEEEWDDLYIKPLCERLNPHTRKEDLMLRAKASYAATFWLIENHFDYLGLIPMGLALDATGKAIYHHENNNQKTI